MKNDYNGIEFKVKENMVYEVINKNQTEENLKSQTQEGGVQAKIDELF
jgi:hypothetical protein